MSRKSSPQASRENAPSETEHPDEEQTRSHAPQDADKPGRGWVAPPGSSADKDGHGLRFVHTGQVRQLPANDLRAIHEFEIWLKTVGIQARDKRPVVTGELEGRSGSMTELCDAAFEASFHRSLRRRESTGPNEPTHKASSDEVQAGLDELRAELQAEIRDLREQPNEIARLRSEIDDLRQQTGEIATLRAEVDDLRREGVAAAAELAEHRKKEEQRRATLFANQKALGEALSTVARNTEGLAGNLKEVELAVHAWQDGCSAKLVGLFDAIIRLSRGLRTVKDLVETRTSDPSGDSLTGAPVQMTRRPTLIDYADPVDRNPPPERSFYDDDVELDPSG